MTSATPKPRAGEHTKGPWYSDQDGFIYTERDDEDQIVVAKAHEHSRMNATLMNARRIVACVNYCEGLPTDYIELHRLSSLHGDTIAERDALAAQLTQALAAISDVDGLFPENWWLRKHADIIQTAHDRILLAKHGR